MRATIDGIDVEGSPEEIAKFIAAFRGATVIQSESASKRNSSPPDDGNAISETFAYHALKRLPLSTAQRHLLSILKDTYPEWTTLPSLQRALQVTPNQLGGIFGGLGRRVSATKGWESGYCLWEYRWDDDEGVYAYRLPASVAAALERVEL